MPSPGLVLTNNTSGTVTNLVVLRLGDLSVSCDLEGGKGARWQEGPWPAS